MLKLFQTGKKPSGLACRIFLKENSLSRKNLASLRFKLCKKSKEDKTMPYRAAKISFDGSHYIATPKENFPQGHKRRRPTRPLSVEEVEQKAQFEVAYKESQKLPRKERKAYMQKAMEETIPDKEQRKEYVERNNERKTTNKIRRKVRLAKKVNLQREWNFFCTFTFSDTLHTEESFRKSLRNTFKHLVARKGWKHVGVWERGGENGRLHFHGIFYIPPGGMVGEIVETKDYSTKDHRMQTAHQNTYFLERYGRNDFQALGSPMEVQHSLGYLMKYIEKSGERLIYGGNLPTYFVSDVMDEDVICPFGIEDRKAILADNFTCIFDGEIMGTVSKEVIEKMPKAN